MLVRTGMSRNRPAPAVPAPLKKEMPRRSCGRKPATAVRAREGRSAWMGRVVMLVLVLGRLVRADFTWEGGAGWLTSLIRWSWMCF